MAACVIAMAFVGCSSADSKAPGPGATMQPGTSSCGNGFLDPGEACDGFAIAGGATCATETNGAYPTGNLTCSADCTKYDARSCTNATGKNQDGVTPPPPPPPSGAGGAPPFMQPGAGGSLVKPPGAGGAPPFGAGGGTPLPPVGGAGALGSGGAPPLGTGGMPIGQGGAAPPGPMNPTIPMVSGDCPQWGNTTITFMGLAGIQIAAGAKPAAASAPMLIYWHGTGSNAGEFATMAAPVATGVTAAGGVIVSFNGTTGGDLNSGTFIFGAGDLKLVDQLVACAVRDHGIDPRKIYTMGCSAGGLMSAATAALRSSYIAAAAPNSGGFPVLTPAFENGHTPALMTVHGKKGSDVVVIDFADASALADMTFKQRSGFVIDCDTGGGHCGGSPLAGDVWKFFQAHPFGVSPEPWAGGLPAGFSAQCKIQ
jgi:predicted esterase